MIEGYNIDGVCVLINPRYVTEVYGSGTDGHSNPWCNVKMTNGTVHRFTGISAQKVYRALLVAPVQD